MSVVGIDIGTEFSKVAVAFRKKIEMVGNDLSKLQTPTLISFGKDQRYFGDMAFSSQSSNIENTVPQIKRLFGRQATDARLKQELDDWFLCTTATLDDGRIGIEVETTKGKQVLAPEQVMAGYLTKLKDFTSKHLEGLTVKDVVIGCPAFFDDSQRRAILTAARLADLNVLRLMNETTAIALNYGILRQLPENETRRVIFVDVGTSNTQVAVVDFVKGKLKTRYTAANPFAGGRDLDMALFNHFREQWKSESGLDVRDNKRVTLRLMKEVNRVKKMLSGNKDAVLPLDCFQNDKDFTMRIERAAMEEAAAGVLKAICEPLAEALDAIKDDKVKLHSVEIVGGPSKVPSIQQAVLSTIQTVEPDIKQLSFTLNFNESVARGCALMCAMISPNFKVRDFEVTDINSWPITIEYPSEKDGLTEQLIIKRGAPSPCTAKVTFFKDKGFEFKLRHPTNVRLSDDKTMSVTYPFGTQREIGAFQVGMVNASENLVGDSKIKFFLSLNRHGILDRPQATLIEFVKKEEAAPEVANDKGNDKKDDKNEKSGDATDATKGDDKANDDKSKNDESKMEVDSEETGEKKDGAAMETDENSEQTGDVGSEAKANDTEMKDASKKEDNSNDNDEKAKQKRSKKKVTTILPIAGKFLNDVTNEQFENWKQLESQLFAQDRVVVETQEKHNELETYVYDMRDKLDMSHREYISEQGREKFNASLQEIEDWLYGDGEHAQKEEYVNKLRELRSFGDPIEVRYFEAQNRENRITNLKKLIFKYQQWVNTTDEKYEHIGEEDRKKVKEAADKTDQWLMDKQKQQDKLNTWDNPAILCKEIDHQYRDLLNSCNPIVQKPKPPPPKKEEKKEENKDEKKDGKDEKGNDSTKDGTNENDANNSNNDNNNEKSDDTQASEQEKEKDNDKAKDNGMEVE